MATKLYNLFSTSGLVQYMQGHHDKGECLEYLGEVQYTEEFMISQYGAYDEYVGGIS